MRFRLFPSDLEGSGSYRVLYPYGCLEAYGGHPAFMEIAGQPVAGKLLSLHAPEPAGDIPEAYDADIYVFQRRLEKTFNVGGRILRQWTPYGVVDVVEWLQGHGKTVVVDVDDWIHDLPVGHPALSLIAGRPDLSFQVLADIVKRADILTCSTPTLAEMYRRPDAVVLPNYLHWPTWADHEPVYDRDRPLTIGWMGAFGWRGTDLSVLRGLIGPWLERHPRVRFAAVGGREPHDYLGIPEPQRLTLPYTVFPGHALTTQVIDIGLVPLELSRFNDCKSHLKGLEYAALGIPCIASPSAPYQEWIEPDVNGLLARKPRHWIRALDALVENDAWRDLGRNARAKARQHTIEAHYPEWEAVFAPDSCSQPDPRPAPVHEAQLPAAA